LKAFYAEHLRIITIKQPIKNAPFTILSGLSDVQ